MGTNVRLRIFSGLEDPRWTLKDSEDQHFRRWLAAARSQGIGLIAPEQDIPEDDLPTCGYRGFEVGVEGLGPVVVYQNALVAAKLGGAPRIDQFLFETNHQSLEDDFGLNIGLLEARPPESIKKLPATCPTAGLRCGPLRFPGAGSAWDVSPNRGNNLCYNYANNVMTRQTVFPGDSRSGSLNIDDLTRLLHGDALEFAGMDLPNACPRNPQDHYVAAVLNTIGSRGDYHFFRLDGEGRWSQKNSTGAINNRDDRKPHPQPLDNLCGAEFNAERLFVGFFVSTERTRQILAARGGGLA